MSSASIEIRWGAGLESKEDRFEARKILKPAITIALESMEMLGVDVADRSYVNVHQNVEPDYPVAVCTGAKTMHIRFRPSELSGNEKPELYYAKGIIHELLHEVRQQHVRLDNLLEFSACEGLAYTGEYLASRALTPDIADDGVVALVKRMGPESLASLRQAFLDVATQPNSWTDAAHNSWVNEGYIRKLGKAEIIGISVVAQQLDEGFTHDGLLPKTPAEVLLVA